MFVSYTKKTPNVHILKNIPNLISEINDVGIMSNTHLSSNLVESITEINIENEVNYAI